MQPLCIGSTRIPTDSAQNPPKPTIRLSLLIALPSPEISKARPDLPKSEDDMDEMPEMVIGSTYFTPTISAGPANVGRATTKTSSEKGDLKGEVEVAHLEYGNLSDETVRKAIWVRKGDKWVIEGLEDCTMSSRDR
jgi:hypothetical protein